MREQVIFAVTLAIFYFDEIVDNYWFKTHGNYDLQDYVPGLNTFSDDGQPWAIPVRISLIFFFSTAATISFCSFAQCANELVHTIPGLGNSSPPHPPPRAHCPAQSSSHLALAVPPQAASSTPSASASSGPWPSPARRAAAASTLQPIRPMPGR